MVPKPAKDATAFRLPPTVTTPADLTQLARELESLNDYIYQAGLRTKPEDIVLPKTSRGFDDLVDPNKLSLLAAEDRKLLAAFLQVLHNKAPVLHVSFSVEPSSAFVARLVVWLRQQVSPFVLVRIGRQPTVGGGCVVRTTNKQFDFSLRQYLQAQRGQLAGALAKAAAAGQAAA